MSPHPEPTLSSDSQSPHRVVPASRRRDKPILSCTLCRRRKLKCDRQQPCKTCTDRGLALSCSYTKHPTGPGHDSKAPYNVHDRIDQLERLVTTLMAQKDSQSPPPSSVSTKMRPLPVVTDDDTAAELAESLDRVKLDNDATSYTSSAHWTSILEGISEVKEELDQIPTTAQPRDSSLGELAGPDLLFGRQRHASLNDILAAIPPRAEADQLIVTYFASMDMAPAFSHKPTFLKEYDNFWEQPYKTPIMWIGVLLSMLGMAIRFQSVLVDTVEGQPPPDISIISSRMDFYREKVVQCLVLGNYSKCPPYTLECFMHYFVSEYLRSSDTQFGTWMLVGMMVRIAFRMGYHREPSRFKNITAFQGEMRRRLWSLLVQLDLMSSTQVGLPRMIHPSQYDVQVPRNLHDHDLYEDMDVLPPSRPESETTLMLHQIVRIRVLQVFSQVVDIASASNQPQYREIMELENGLRTTYDALPENMRAIRAIELDGVQPDTGMRRIFLGLTFLKAEIMLHRPYCLLGRIDSRYEYSRLACLDAALEVLALQRKLNIETRPGGHLYSQRWKLWAVSWRLSALVMHDFLLATTVLLIDLDKDLQHPLTYPPDNANRVPFKSGQPTRAEIVEALTLATDIWEQQSKRSREAKKVFAAIKLVLGKVNADSDQEVASGDDSTPMSQFDFANFVQQPMFDPAMNTDQDSSFLLDNPHFIPPMFQSDPLMDFSNFNNSWTGLETEVSMPSISMPTFDQNIQNCFQG